MSDVQHALALACALRLAFDFFTFIDRAEADEALASPILKIPSSHVEHARTDYWVATAAYGLTVFFTNYVAHLKPVYKVCNALCDSDFYRGADLFNIITTCIPNLCYALRFYRFRFDDTKEATGEWEIPDTLYALSVVVYYYCCIFMLALRGVLFLFGDGRCRCCRRCCG